MNKRLALRMVTTNGNDVAYVDVNDEYGFDENTIEEWKAILLVTDFKETNLEFGDTIINLADVLSISVHAYPEDE